ncbi:beclin 1-associated autophagy-related key regulator [Schistocerca piceifrons]|uniref:beclin 1-associated autophagy-related key regulator n=1 Tax=Schistocerca piceifrons TaxID=274613 RepID=UPI001F5E47D2|nr:beclin 1-associated autophagy-related key regulator [Schistocerca piceifrons]XP_049813422.1 beclin 1-associated autophagy-related key regulator [Schistocerca nitens]
MAASSSDGSCEDLALMSIEDSCSRYSSTVGKCPLCGNYKKAFYCKQCVQNGDFIHSKCMQSLYPGRKMSSSFDHVIYRRFADKQINLLRLKNDKCQVEKHCEELLWKRLKANELQCEIDACKERIRLLELLNKETALNIVKGRNDVAALIETNKQRADRLPRYEERVCRLQQFVANLSEDVEERRQSLQKIQDELKHVIRSSIQQLVQYIFPIAQVPSAQSEEDNETQDTVSALAEATRTAYVKGKWVFTDSSGELHHCIVAPSLPGSGDYSAYNAWVAANRDGVPSGNSDVDHNAAYNISAALTYTTQLINVLAFYLDVWLPAKLSYSDFCSHEMSDHQFARRVARLNTNILHLCFSQNVNPELLRPSHTLQNVLHLLNTQVSDLGRQGPFEVDCNLTKSLEEQLARELGQNESSDSEDESDNLPMEWEAVPHVSCPESSPGPMSLGSQQALTSTQQATSMAGGLVTSAAASIASIWRGWTGNR